MKQISPAEFIVEKDRRKLHLCAKHAAREADIRGTVVTALPKESGISCSGCSADFANI
jgi:hypothetical protein